ncbi:zinc finger BED domain-containing protein RICESLEEPER 2-like [Ipomoea triloba]|uniref:zinc finger BED domain-containing protein RICESLEEPER 2-like n=1 Tax=Ipomoea triloba TaxID=35885 RepID=UPI00125DCD6B|nr:zinc finger BED domain-containing protein RICESLEEPER 2-like [Ipomoea triloba]
MKCASTSGTSGLKAHNQRCVAFKNHIDSATQKNITVVESASVVKSGSSNLVAVGFNQYACRRETVKMIILDELPFCFVDGAGTTTVSYMVITAHYIDVNWKMHRKIINFKPISDHKGETIAKELENCLIDWGIKKVFTITVDNASVNDAIRILKNKLKCWREDPLILGGEFIHVRCCAHILNLIVKDGLATVGNSVVSVRNAVKYVRSSNSRFQAFRICSEQDKLTREKDENGKRRVGPPLSDDWENVRRVGPPLSDDWENVRRLVQFLKIFYDATLAFSSYKNVFYDATLAFSSYKNVTSNATLAFSSYKNVTSSHCFNDICTIEANLNVFTSSRDAIEANLNVFTSSRDVNMSNMAFEMKKKFDKYWEGLEINKLLIISSVFDPRRKMGFVTICFEKLYGKDTPKFIEMKEAVMEVLHKLYEVYNALYAKPSATTNQSGVGRGSESGSGSGSGSQSCETSEMELLDVGVNIGSNHR